MIQPSANRNTFILGLQCAAGLMMAQQIAGKAARDGLFLQYYGPGALPAMIAGAAAFSVLLSLAGGKIMQSFAPRTVVPWALGASGVLQVCEWRLLNVNPGAASIVIYLHMAGVGVVLLSAFWSMLNEEFDPREAKRQFGRIAAGGILGGLVGGAVAERTVAWSGAPALMIILAGLHFACGAFIAALMRRGSPPQMHGGVENARLGSVPPYKSPLLVTLGAVVLLGSVGAALLDYVFKVYATETWGRGSDLVRVFAFFHTGVALLSFILQSSGSKLFLERFGLGKTALTLPATLSIAATTALVVPGVLAAGIGRAAEAAIRGSLFRAAYETCYTPVPAAEKRLAKAFIDVMSERGGDALGAGIVFACLTFAGQSAPPYILSIAALVGISSFVVCRALDRVYLKALARSLESRAVQIGSPSDLDLTTRSLLLRAPAVRVAAPGLASAEDSAQASGTAIFRQDAILMRLSALRSDDLLRVHGALHNCDVSDPLIATQVCSLLGRDEHAQMAILALTPAAARVVGLLADLMLNPAMDVKARRRIPRVIASAGSQRAMDALMLGLEDSRFDVRFECARSLAKALAKEPRLVVATDRVIAAVDRELAIGRVLWESHRQQQRDPAGSGAEWLDGMIRDKAHGSLEYVFTLLSLVYDRPPLTAAFRSLHLEDRHLRGTALEYLEGLLPPRTREMLWEILQERPSRSGDRARSEIMNELLKASETVVLRLRAMPGDGGGA